MCWQNYSIRAKRSWWHPLNKRFRNDVAFVYMLRGWQEPGPSGVRFWRFSLEDPHTGTRRGFPNLESLWAFFAEQLGGDEKLDEGSHFLSYSP